MRTIDTHDGPDRRIAEPTECPGCGAEKTRRAGAKDDDMAIDVSFACGAKVRWRSVGHAVGGASGYSESLAELRTCPPGLSAVLAKARADHPELRMGQLVWTAAHLARKELDAGNPRVGATDDAKVFYIDDETMAMGLSMVSRDHELPGDGASQMAERIKSYLVRKVGASLDGETTDHIARLIREGQ